jgi:hypothetical protein
MAKAQSFADKVARAALSKGYKCPVCGVIRQPILLVASERSSGGRTWRFNERRVQLCKCNEKELYA